MTEHEQNVKAKERIEQEYDALITQLNRCQAQLSNKAAQAQKLPIDDYRQWLAEKKQEQTELIAAIQKKKAERAEARRKFNSWEPAHREEWLDWPDCEGWWWFYGTRDDRPASHRGFDMQFFAEDGNGRPVISTGDNHRDDELSSFEWHGRWKFQAEPEQP